MSEFTNPNLDVLITAEEIQKRIAEMGADIARDYYTALDTHGVRLWVFRERRAPHGWFLHGIFG